jgi:hypothetical protein
VAAVWAMIGWWLGRRYDAGAAAKQQSAATAEASR